MRVTIVGLICVLGVATLQADEIDGALWKFQMTLKDAKSGQPGMRGQFRVKNNVVYQKSTPDQATFDKPIGKNVPTGTKTRMQMTDMRAFTKDQTIHNGIKGTVVLKMERFGEWSGTFIDGRGRHWNFQCTRVQE